MRRKRPAPLVNAGSMADIAFLLLIFFLVTTTIASDKGFNRKLPKNCPPGEICMIYIHERNILKIQLNEKQQVMVNNELININNLKSRIIHFVDNNGDNSCNYCNGFKQNNLSDNPTKAVISLSSSAATYYDFFIKVQDEITKAYFDLRTNYAKNILNKPLEELTEKQLLQIKKAYPFIVSEAKQTKKIFNYHFS